MFRFREYPHFARLRPDVLWTGVAELGVPLVGRSLSGLLDADGVLGGRSGCSRIRVCQAALWRVKLIMDAGMDAIDGKQARRVGMASALGEMFDHGCGGWIFPFKQRVAEMVGGG